jgi:hypothetical protein
MGGSKIDPTNRILSKNRVGNHWSRRGLGTKEGAESMSRNNTCAFGGKTLSEEPGVVPDDDWVLRVSA